MANMLNVIYLPHPLLNTKEIREIPFKEGMTVADAIIAAEIDKNKLISVQINSSPVLVKDWGIRVLSPEDLFSVSAEVADGGDEGSNPLQIVAIAALAYFTMGAGAGWIAGTFSVGSTAASIIGAGLYLAGSTLLYSMTTPDPKALRDTGGAGSAASPSYALNSGSNRMRPYECMPVVLGVHKVVPDFGSRPFTVVENNDQYLYAILNYGLTQVVSLDPAQEKIGETLISDFQDVEYYYNTAKSIKIISNTAHALNSGDSVNLIFNTLVSGPSKPADGTYTVALVTSSTVFYVAKSDMENTESVSTVSFNSKTGTAYRRPKGLRLHGFDEGDIIPENVDVVEGGDLEYVDTGTVNGWVIRTSSVDTEKLAITLEGNLYGINTSNGSIQGNSATIRAEYQPDEDNSTWYPFDNQLGDPANYWSKGYYYTTTDTRMQWIMVPVEYNYGADGLFTSIAESYQPVSYTTTHWQQTGFSPTLNINEQVDGSATGQTVNGYTEIWRWVAPFGAAHPFIEDATPSADITISNSSTDLVRKTIFCRPKAYQGGQYGKTSATNTYKVRVKIKTDTSNTSIAQFRWSALNCYQTTTPLDPGIYLDEYRVGLRIKATAKLNGSLPPISSVVSAASYYVQDDPNTTTVGDWIISNTSTISRRVEDIFLTFAKGRYSSSGQLLWGAGLDASQIDLTSIKAWKTWSESKYNGTVTRDFTCSFVLDKEMSVAEVLEAIARNGYATPTWANGKLGVVFDEEDQTPVAVFGMSNIIAGSFEVSWANENKVDEVQVNYIDGTTEVSGILPTWDQKTIRVPGDITNSANPVSIDLFGCVEGRCAGLYANYTMANQNYRARRIIWETDIEGFVCQRGDTVLLSHDLTQWGYSGRVVDFYISAGNGIVVLDREIPPEALGNINIRFPDGIYEVLPVTTTGVTTDTLNVGTLTQGWLDSHKITDYWMDSMWCAAPEATPGKRVKIISIEYVSQYRVKITAVDDDPEFYTAWYTGTFAAPDNVSLLTNDTAAIGTITVTQGDWLFVPNMIGRKINISWPASGNINYSVVQLFVEKSLSGTVYSEGLYAFTVHDNFFEYSFYDLLNSDNNVNDYVKVQALVSSYSLTDTNTQFSTQITLDRRPTINAPTNFTIESGTNHLVATGDGTVVPRIYVSWTEPVDTSGLDLIKYGSIQLRYKVYGASDSTYIYLPPLSGTTTFAYINNVIESTTYTVQIRSTDRVGRNGTWTAIADHAVVGKTAAPTTPTGLTLADQDGEYLYTTWNGISDLDLQGYVFKAGGTTWSDAYSIGDSLYSIPGSSASPAKILIPAGSNLYGTTFTLRLKSKDTSGNYSSTENTLSVTVSSSAPVNTPTITGVTCTATADGNIKAKVDYSYTQPSTKRIANFLTVYYRQTNNSFVSSDATQIVDVAPTAGANTGSVYFIVPPNVANLYFGISASRVTEFSGTKATSIASYASNPVTSPAAVFTQYVPAYGGTGGDRAVTTIVANDTNYSMTGEAVVTGTIAGVRAGTLTWATDGSTVTGSGVAITSFGILAANNGTETVRISSATGNAYFKGTVAASAGTIGGFSIAAAQLYTGTKSTYADTSSGVYLGTDGIVLGDTFRVSTSGILIATNAVLTGTVTASAGTIGGFTISTAQLYTGSKSSFSSTLTGVYVGTDGIALGNSFSVNTGGTLTVSNANISGTISAAVGTIAGFTLRSSSLYTGSKAAYNDTIAGVYIGTDGIGLGGSSGVVSPFRVDSAGNLNATNATISGTIQSATIINTTYTGGSEFVPSTTSGSIKLTGTTVVPNAATFGELYSNSNTGKLNFYASGWEAILTENSTVNGGTYS